MLGAGGPGGSRAVIASPSRRSPPSATHRPGTAPPTLMSRSFADFAPRHLQPPQAFAPPPYGGGGVAYGSPAQVFHHESSLISMPPSTVGRNAQRYVPTPTNGVQNFSIAMSRVDEDSFVVGAASPPRNYRSVGVTRLDMGSSPAPALEEPPAGRKTPVRTPTAATLPAAGHYRNVSPTRRNTTPRGSLDARLVDDLSPVMRQAASPTRRSARHELDALSSPTPVITALQQRVAALESDRASLLHEFESYRSRTDELLAACQHEIEWLRSAVDAQRNSVASPRNQADALLVDALRQERDSAVKENQTLREQLTRLNVSSLRLASPTAAATSTPVMHKVTSLTAASTAPTSDGRGTSPPRRVAREPGVRPAVEVRSGGNAASSPPKGLSIEEDLQRRLAERARRFHAEASAVAPKP